MFLDTSQPTRVTLNKPGSGACHPRRALRGNLVLPAPLRPTLACTQRQRQGRRRAALPYHDKIFNLAQDGRRPLPGHASDQAARMYLHASDEWDRLPPSSRQVPDLAGEGRCQGSARSDAEGRDRRGVPLTAGFRGDRIARRREDALAAVAGAISGVRDGADRRAAGAGGKKAPRRP
jgi:hypothetical protein